MRWEQTVGLVRWGRFGPRMTGTFVGWRRIGPVARFGRWEEMWHFCERLVVPPGLHISQLRFSHVTDSINSI